MIKPLNTQKNRNLNLVSSSGELIQNKHGIIHFKLTANGNSVYLKCDKGNFKDNFRAEENMNEDKIAEPAVLKNIFIEYLTAKKVLL